MPGTDQDQVLDAVKRGEIRPLAEIQAVAEKAMPGQFIGVEIKRRKGRLVYEFKIIATGGRLVRFISTAPRWISSRSSEPCVF